ncbi:hypothetical protein [Streptomyces sp. NBC_00454]|uniref:hypothetical protein n=1 Tax=Streptomyces sp. NBC_00454 TaxID=2975747 RepID=UPI00324A5413
MNVRATAIAATAAFALAALGAGPAFADNHSTVAPQDVVVGAHGDVIYPQPQTGLLSHSDPQQ